MKKSAIAVIPARGGSKRIHRKNIRLFNNKPMIAYSIEVARESKLFDRVIVSTNDQEIADIARSYGAEVPFVRPEELADDHTGTAEVVVHALQTLADMGSLPDFVCCIYATVPMLRAEYLEQGLNSLIENPDKSYAFGVTEHRYPVQRSFTLEPDEKEGEVITPLYPDCLSMRSQDLQPVYHDTGQFYWGKSSAFIENHDIFSSQAIPVRLPHYLVQDVDTMDDWRRAEVMYRAIQQLIDNDK